MNAAVPLNVLQQEAEFLQLRVHAIRYEADSIHSYELRPAFGGELPKVEAGAHVDVHLGPGLIRSYSISSDPQDRSSWTLGVLKEKSGRGGSKAMHERVRVGDVIEISAPRNAFRLAHEAAHSVLIAGGIGITPIKAMAHTLARDGHSFELHYCARSKENAAFLSELRKLVGGDQLHLHFDGGDRNRGLDLKALLADRKDGAHVYFCGPGGFLDACSAAASHWPSGTVHSEHFKAPEKPQAAAPQGSFELELKRSGVTLQVKPEQTIVRAIELAGMRVPTSCLSGLCGACKVEYLEGEVEHNDYILSDEEKTHCFTACVSRAKSARLVLDI